jgi:hypothetical protein
MTTAQDPSFVIKLFAHDGRQMFIIERLPVLQQITTELKRIHGPMNPRNNIVVFNLPANYDPYDHSILVTVLRMVPLNAGLEEMARTLVTIAGVGVITYTDWAGLKQPGIVPSIVMEPGDLQEQRQKPPIFKETTQLAFGEALGDDLREPGVRFSVVKAHDLQKQTQKLPMFNETNQPAIREIGGDYQRDFDSRKSIEEIDLEPRTQLSEIQRLSKSASTNPAHGGPFIASSVQINPYTISNFSNNTPTMSAYSGPFDFPSMQTNPYTVPKLSGITLTTSASSGPLLTPSPSVQSDGSASQAYGEPYRQPVKRQRLFKDTTPNELRIWTLTDEDAEWARSKRPRADS